MDFEQYFRDKNLHKTPRIGVHYEQKTTPDLLWCVAHVILDVTKDDRTTIFSDKDVRQSPVFNSLMQDYFSKPPQEDAENEYNKVSSYQLGVLAFAGVLEQVGERPKKYKIKDLPVLEYIAINDLNASRFLSEYTEKFLRDNGLFDAFEIYRQNPNQSNHLIAKEAYWDWARVNTAVKGNDRRHTYRVFNKIFNVFCYKHRLPGEDASNITTGPCPYSFLIYNRANFRDENMPSGMTRQQYRDEVLSEIEQGGVVETLLQKAKDTIKEKYGNDSEIKEEQYGYLPNGGVHVHHILPRHSFPQFSLSRENLIALTPGQHLSSAHIEANTRTINPQFQIVCLRRKLQHLRESLTEGESFYDLSEFVRILNTCFGWELSENATIDIVESKVSTLPTA